MSKTKLSKFQFHKGTIKTDHGRNNRQPFAEFQFHKGTIKTKSFNDVGFRCAHFNSIKVRLKL